MMSRNRENYVSPQGDVHKTRARGYLAGNRCNIAARRNRSLSHGGRGGGGISKWLHSHGIAHTAAAKSLGAPAAMPARI